MASGRIVPPAKHEQGDSRWRPGDRVLIQLATNHGPRVFTYAMATLVLRDWAGQWWFRMDGVTYPQYENGPDLSFCTERWIHEPPVLQRLAEI
ncbi:MAG: hypothetical protein AB7L09_02645 [Nitrospira sp.]